MVFAHKEKSWWLYSHFEERHLRELESFGTLDFLNKEIQWINRGGEQPCPSH
jgi:hypothetical protein